MTLISPEESNPVVIFTVRYLGSSFPSLQPRGDAFSLNSQILSEEHHRQCCMVFSVLGNGKEKGNMLLLIFSVNLRTHTYPQQSGSGWVFPQLWVVNQTDFTQRGRSSLQRKQDLGFRRKAASRARLNWQGSSRPELSLKQVPSSTATHTC